MVSTWPPTSKSSSPFNNPLVTVPKAPITNGIIVTFMFHSFFLFSSKVEVLILLFTFFVLFCGQPRQRSRQFYKFFFFLFFFFFYDDDFLNLFINSKNTDLFVDYLFQNIFILSLNLQQTFYIIYR